MLVTKKPIDWEYTMVFSHEEMKCLYNGTNRTTLDKRINDGFATETCDPLAEMMDMIDRMYMAEASKNAKPNNKEPKAYFANDI